MKEVKWVKKKKLANKASKTRLFPSPLLSAQLGPPLILQRPRKEVKKEKVSVGSQRRNEVLFFDGTGWISPTRSPPLLNVVLAVARVVVTSLLSWHSFQPQTAIRPERRSVSVVSFRRSTQSLNSRGDELGQLPRGRFSRGATRAPRSTPRIGGGAWWWGPAKAGHVDSTVCACFDSGQLPRRASARLPEISHSFAEEPVTDKQERRSEAASSTAALNAPARSFSKWKSRCAGERARTRELVREE
ncbi:hypothetical protein HPB51_002593 [Rhipicephalus microplus]|uniref:Uncharacterized protein n=1 Tax=Rhipicephalus microplus TaxID=6941 RepID=A0A9J6DES7_RHIMP|nr:hypothetical protein HPB51_002593 [Rhipicephalus microplus]